MSVERDFGPQSLERTLEPQPRNETRRTIAAFAAKIGNELNNPFAALQAAHEYIKRRTERSEEARRDEKLAEMLAVVDSELAKARRMAADLVDFSAERPIVRTSFVLRDIVADVDRATPRPAGVRFENLVPEEMRPVSADRERLARALARIVRNGIDAIPADRAGEVAVSATLEGERLQIDVRDDGLGIDEFAMSRISEPLFGTKVKGLGLGVSIATAMISEQGGELRCATRLGAGTVFTIVLPHA
jgi:C4-dicarboxylate-specific signal transduction histidine kinase